MSTSRLPLLIAVVALSGGIAPVARAAESYDSCKGFVDSVPAVIGTQGIWCLRRDLSYNAASGDAIHVAANNVTVDCNGFKLGGLSAGQATDAFGIGADGTQNTTVRNCNLRGFLYGVRLEGGSGHLVEDNRIDGSTHVGIYSNADQATIRRNLVFDTGGRPEFNGNSHGIYAAGDADILDNTVAGVVPTTNASGYSWAHGIHVLYSNRGTVAGNRVSGLVSQGQYGWSVGIDLDDSFRIIIRDNHVTAEVDGPSDYDMAIGCSHVHNIASGNIMAGWNAFVVNCQDAGNYEGLY